MKNKKIAGLIAAGAVVLGMGLTGCSDKYQEQFKDGPRNGVDKGAAMVIEMPDGFNNLATKCIGDIRYTVTFHGDSSYGSVTTVVDPECKGQ